MALLPPDICTGCAIPLVHGESVGVPQGCARHKARGLCSPCHRHARGNGTLDAFTRVRTPVAETAENFQMLDMLGYTKPQIAQKLEMTVHGLNRALQRHRLAVEKAAAREREREELHAAVAA